MRKGQSNSLCVPRFGLSLVQNRKKMYIFPNRQHNLSTDPYPRFPFFLFPKRSGQNKVERHIIADNAGKEKITKLGTFTGSVSGSGRSRPSRPSRLVSNYNQLGRFTMEGDDDLVWKPEEGDEEQGAIADWIVDATKLCLLTLACLAGRVSLELKEELMDRMPNHPSWYQGRCGRGS